MMRKILSLILVGLFLVATITACKSEDGKIDYDSIDLHTVDTSEEVNIDPLLIEKYTYTFNINVDSINVSLPAKVNDYLVAGLSPETEFAETIPAQTTVPATFLTPNGKPVQVILSNPTWEDLDMGNAYIIGMALTFDDEFDAYYGETTVSPAITPAVQKSLISKLTMTDTEIVMDYKLKMMGKDYSYADYTYGINNETAMVHTEYEDETLSLVDIKYENLFPKFE